MAQGGGSGLPDDYAQQLQSLIQFAGNKTEVGGDLEVDGKAKLGYVGKTTFNQDGVSYDFFVHEAIFTNGVTQAPRFVIFLPFIENVTSGGASFPVIKDIYGVLINNKDGTPATTIDEALNGMLSDVPFPLALQGNWNSAEFGALHVADLIVSSHKIYFSDSTGDFVDLRLIPMASQAKYQHTVTISGQGFEFCFTAPSSKNIVIDSYEDLGIVFGGERIGLTGYSHALSAKPVLIDLHGGSVNNDFIRVFEENGNTFANHTLSSLGAITYADDVYIPN